LLKTFVDVGSEVKEGQLLAVMEAPKLLPNWMGRNPVGNHREAITSPAKRAIQRLFETSKTPGTVSLNGP